MPETFFLKGRKLALLVKEWVERQSYPKHTLKKWHMVLPCGVLHAAVGKQVGNDLIGGAHVFSSILAGLTTSSHGAKKEIEWGLRANQHFIF